MKNILKQMKVNQPQKSYPDPPPQKQLLRYMDVLIFGRESPLSRQTDGQTPLEAFPSPRVDESENVGDT